MSEKWKQAVLNCDCTLHDAISNLNRSGLRIVLVINRNGVLEVLFVMVIFVRVVAGFKTEVQSQIFFSGINFVTSHAK